MYTKKTMEELGRHEVSAALSADKHQVIIILDDVRSMHNVGATFRTCDAFSVAALYLCGFTPQPPHRDIHKTALGATETVQWQHFAQVTDAIAAAKATGYTCYGVEQVHNSTMLDEYGAAAEKIALIFGNEVSGVSDAALAMVDGCIEIPQWGAKHSLNISVSVGVVLWEVVKQQQEKQ